MQYRIQFLDGSANVLREWSANARSVADAVSLVIEIDWPPHAVTMRVLDANGREVANQSRSRARRRPRRFRTLALHSRRTLAEPSRNWIRYCMSRVRAVQSPPLSIRATGIERRPACPSSALIGDDEVGSAWIGGQARATFGRMTEGETVRQPTQLRRRRHDNRAAAAGQPPSCKRRARRRHARDAPQMRRRADVSGSDLVEART